MIAHNGEINTLRGNVNWLRAREKSFESPVFGKDLNEALPTLPVTDFSDSQALDNFIEMATMASNRSLSHTLAMSIPQAWQGNESLTPEQKGWYQYHSSLLEGFDGPALVTATDGSQLVATLDRNGLRPCRYYVTNDRKIVCSSEVGVIPDLNPSSVVEKGRLAPGKMLSVDFEKKELLQDHEIKESLAKEHPYGEWINNETFHLKRISKAGTTAKKEDSQIYEHLGAFGYTKEHLDSLLAPMANTGAEELGSMGNDTPLAVLSDLPRSPFDYVQQLFAQVCTCCSLIPQLTFDRAVVGH